ncbi:hypothetical protein A2165_04535 [Candidatus Curtissbacteria bacterium RBG_13_40_7]|uniref:Polymerase nucleotidyl transferase domain-containing protein n=1 Tax=Candidatus Curtissbacteria bacterium RBG_13_40_7 TaxID=1797706 RepID=A0A1F5FZE1_9BACT|nr:MAG: hypothetical protein A2165_04535 [Candidatus Curtissbacteria bacterium RBG_13_40_7]
MTLSQSILATLIYHDIFNYPLAKEEIHKYLIGKISSFAPVSSSVDRLVKLRKIESTNDFIFLKNRIKITKLRGIRRNYSKIKLKRAILFSNMLKIIPTLNLVAVSGALAMENSHKNDDIDLVLVSAKNTIWTTRFLASILLWPYRRRPSGKKISNKACLNLFIDESDLKIQPQNLYLAHEICQMKPLWNRNGTYQKFLKANSWVKTFLPNWEPEKVKSGPVLDRVETRSGKSKFFSSLITHNSSLAEELLKSFQLLYMRSKITTERIGKTQLFFHPAGTQESVLSEYQRRLKKLRI